MPHDFSVRAVDAQERMDDPHADRRMLARTYAQFPLVNAFVARWRRLYVHDIRPRAHVKNLSILDVGAGGADLTRALARWLQRDGLRFEIVALDSDTRAVQWAVAHTDTQNVQFRTALLADLVASGETYDIVLSNHVLHHLSADELLPFLSDSRALLQVAGLASHHDIERDRRAYRLFSAATWPFQTTLLSGSFIREDGLTSIRRSYTAAELMALVPHGWTVQRRVPARLELRWEAHHGRA